MSKKPFTKWLRIISESNVYIPEVPCKTINSFIDTLNMISTLERTSGSPVEIPEVKVSSNGLIEISWKNVICELSSTEIILHMWCKEDLIFRETSIRVENDNEGQRYVVETLIKHIFDYL